MTMTTNIATKDERIVDERYEAVFILNRAQIESHICSDDPARKGMTTMRVRLNDAKDSIITESTDGYSLVQVTEKLTEHNIEHYPLDVNPSETPTTKLDGAYLIPQEVLEDLRKGFPRRKNYCAQPWQRSVVVSIGDGNIECGRSDKQGKPQVDTFPQSQYTAFAPVEKVWPELHHGEPKHKATYSIAALIKTLSAIERAGGERVTISLWDDKTSLQMTSVNQYGHATQRDIRALVMPCGSK